MNYIWSVDAIISVLKPEILQKGFQKGANRIQIDSFLTTSDDIFVAVNSGKYDLVDGSLGFSSNEDSVFGLGGQVDGHNHMRLLESFNNGSRIFIIDNSIIKFDVNDFPDVWIFLVKNSLDALADLARYRLYKDKVKVIGITGSNGKTSTTYAIATCLQTKYTVKQFYRTRTSYLSLIMDVLNKLDSSDEFLVVEMQMDGLDQIARFCTITPPDISIITNVNNSHVQKLGSPESILQAKLEIYRGMKEHGKLILNGDSQIIFNWSKLQGDNEFFLYGSSPDFNLFASDISFSTKSILTNYNLNYRNKAIKTNSKIVGKHAVYTGLATASVLLLNGFSLSETCESIKIIKPVPGRLQCFYGQNGCFVIDDAYNANLLSTTFAIEALGSMPVNRRIAFIGSMLELAEFSEREHRKLGNKIKTTVDILITVGESGYYLVDEVLKRGFDENCVFCMDSVENAISLIPTLQLDNQTAVLVKGSGAMRMDRITPYLLTTPIN